MSKIIISNTKGAVPSGTDLDPSDVGINAADSMLFTQGRTVGAFVNAAPQTFEGVKTFDSSPKCSAVPTDPDDMVNLAAITSKEYVGELL